MRGYRITYVWAVESRLVVADTMAEAVELYKHYIDSYEDPSRVHRVTTELDDVAIIKETENETH